MECDYLNRWIKKRSHMQNLTQYGESQRYSWGTQKKKKKKQNSNTEPNYHIQHCTIRKKIWLRCMQREDLNSKSAEQMFGPSSKPGYPSHDIFWFENMI